MQRAPLSSTCFFLFWMAADCSTRSSASPVKLQGLYPSCFFALTGYRHSLVSIFVDEGFSDRAHRAESVAPGSTHTCSCLPVLRGSPAARTDHTAFQVYLHF